MRFINVLLTYLLTYLLYPAAVRYHSTPLSVYNRLDPKLNLKY